MGAFYQRIWHADFNSQPEDEGCDFSDFVPEHSSQATVSTERLTKMRTNEIKQLQVEFYFCLRRGEESPPCFLLHNGWP